MAFDSHAVVIRQTPPRNESQSSGIVVLQNRRPLTIQRALDRGQSRLVHCIVAAGALELLGELIERGLLFHAARKLILGVLAAGDVLLGPDRIKKLAGTIANTGR